MRPTRETVRRALACIWTGSGDDAQFLGNGVFVSAKHVLTARHVVRAEGVWVQCATQGEKPIFCAPKSIHCPPDADLDVACLELPIEQPKVLPLNWRVRRNNEPSLTYAAYMWTGSGVSGPVSEQDIVLEGTTRPALRAWPIHGVFPKGSSGSGVRQLASPRRLVGIVSMTDESTPVGYMVPLVAFEPWLRTLVPRDDGSAFRLLAAVLGLCTTIAVVATIAWCTFRPTVAELGRYQFEPRGSFRVERDAKGRPVLFFSADSHRFDRITIKDGAFVHEHGDIGGSHCPTDGYRLAGGFVNRDRAEGEIAYSRECRETSRHRFVAQRIP